MFSENCYLREIQLLKEKPGWVDGYPFFLPVFRGSDVIEFHPNVTFIIGENGMGKSTLLEAIAVAWGFNPEGGTLNFNFSTRESHSDLYQYIRLIKGIKRPRDGFFLRAESFYNVATNIEKLDEGPGGQTIINSYGGKSLHDQSHGEAFLSVVMNRFGGHGLYILDEPEAALSPLRQMSLLSRIHDLVQQKSQFIIATHSPIIMGYPEAHILQLHSDGFTKVNYEETEHYNITREFIVNREKMIKILLE
ncbi:MAG: AAA family ATPase [Chitinophagales bacterium]